MISVDAADEVVILLDAATNFRRYDDVSGDAGLSLRERLDRAAGCDFEVMRDVHVEDHQRLYRALSIDLGTSEAGQLPTDLRIGNFVGGDDPDLAALYVRYVAT